MSVAKKIGQSPCKKPKEKKQQPEEKPKKEGLIEKVKNAIKGGKN